MRPDSLGTAGSTETKNMPTTSTDTPVVVTITPAQKTAILAKIADLPALITFGVGLSDDQRQKMLKLGTKTVGWDEKAASYMASHPELIPAYVDMAALARTARCAWIWATSSMRISTVVQTLTDTQMVIGNQILKPELAFYNSAQEAAKHGVPGAKPSRMIWAAVCRPGNHPSRTSQPHRRRRRKAKNRQQPLIEMLGTNPTTKIAS